MEHILDEITNIKDIKQSKLDYIISLYKLNHLKIVGEYKGPKEKVTLKCLCCNEINVATPISKKQTYSKLLKHLSPGEIADKYSNRGIGCPTCNKKANTFDYKSRFEQDGITCLDQQQITPQNLKQDFLFLCNICDTKWNDKPYNIYQAKERGDGRTGCPTCDHARDSRYFGNRYSSKEPKIVIDLQTENKIQILESFKGRKEKHSVECMTCNHQWQAVPSILRQSYRVNRTSGCPECAKNTNRDKHLNSEIETFLLENNKIKLLEPYLGSKKQHKMECLICSYQWTATPLSKKQTFQTNGVSGCPQCHKTTQGIENEQFRLLNLENIRKYYDILTNDYIGTRTYRNNVDGKIKIRRKQCGHELRMTPTNLLCRPDSCAICGMEKRIADNIARNKKRSEQWRETAAEWQVYKSKVSSLTEMEYNKHKAEINPNGLPRGLAGEKGAYQLDHKVPKRFCFDNNIPAEICAGKENLQMIKWEDNIQQSSHIKGTLPVAILEYLNHADKFNEWIEEFKYIFPSGQQYYTFEQEGITATIFDPIAKIAIFVTPLSAEFANNKSNRKIQITLEEAGITAFMLFEDELDQHFDLIKKKLIHYSNNSQVKSIYARNCQVVKIPFIDKNKFLNKNHVQGQDTSHVSYGAYHNNQLVAVMTFSKPRVAAGSVKAKLKNNNTWELSRFATDVNFRIPGIASKLLKAFQRDYEWNKIYSFADLRWGIGNMYEKIGFTLERINPPSYWYVIDGKRKHRWNFRKDILKHSLENYNPNLTEYENMVNHGFWRVWDCGTVKYVMEDNK